MDVLHFLKSHHDAIKDGLVRLDDAVGVKARRAAVDDLARDLELHLTLSKDYLYPEISDLFPGAGVLVTTALANGLTISKRLKILTKMVVRPAAEQDGFGKRASELKDAVLKQFEQEEQNLMPKMRSMIRTEDREELGQVFADARADLLSALPAAETAAATAESPPVRAAAPTRSRKRA